MLINLQTKVSDYFAVKELKGAKYGLELEYENARIHDLNFDTTPLTRWSLEPDASLRNNGIEFVSRPTAMNVMSVAVDQMIAAATSIGATPTSRCGLHVHANMSDKTFKEVFTHAVLYSLLEPIIFAEFANGRQESHFCVPTYCNSVLVENMYTDMQKLRRGIPHKGDGKKKMVDKMKYKLLDPFQPQGQAMPGNFVQVNYGGEEVGNGPMPPYLRFCQVAKYSALNYSALRKFGTIEYRHHPSTISRKTLLAWVEFIDRMHTYASTFSDPLDIIQLYDSDGIFTLCENVGLPQTKEIDPLDMDDAVDAATMIAGHEPVDWKDLNWEIA